MGLRPREDGDALWDGLRDGRLSTLATDEYTTSYAVKIAGTDIESTPGGHAGIETRGLFGYSEGVVKRGVPLRRPKGLIAPGSDADIVLWDPVAERTITIDLLHHDGDYSPWEGWRVRGWPAVTFLGGAVAVEHGELLADSRAGSFVPRRVDAEVLSSPAV
jgi:dihydropyrimidinase